MSIADNNTVKNPKRVIEKVQGAIGLRLADAKELDIPQHVITAMQKDFVRF